MELVGRASGEDLELMCKSLPYNPTAGFRGIRYGTNSPLAIVGYDNWTHNAVHMHVWSGSTRPWFDRYFLQEIFRYPFEICKKGLVIGYTQGDNAPVLEFSRRVGFRETYRVRDGWSLGTDLVIQEMRREECRWIKRFYGHPETPSTRIAS